MTLQRSGDGVLERANAGGAGVDVREDGELRGEQLVRLCDRDDDLEHVARRGDRRRRDAVLRQPLAHDGHRFVGGCHEGGDLVDSMRSVTQYVEDTWAQHTSFCVRCWPYNALAGSETA